MFKSFPSSRLHHALAQFKQRKERAFGTKDLKWGSVESLNPVPKS